MLAIHVPTTYFAIALAGFLCSSAGCQLLIGLEVPPEVTDDAPDGGADASPVPTDLCAWQHVHRIDIDNSLIGANPLIDVPVLIVLDPVRVDYTAMRSGGEDLRFATPMGVRVPHEVEQWNPEGVSRVWVKVPRIRPAQNSNAIFMFYGNAEAPDDQQPEQVWSGSYVGVWHFAGHADDATEHDNDGNLQGGPVFQPGGVVGQALSFDGTSDYVEVQPSPSLNDLNAFTYSAWINASAYNQREIFSKAQSDRELRLLDDGDGVRLRGCVVMNVDHSCSNSPGDAVELDRWQHVAMVFDAGSDRLVHLFVNGQEVARDLMESGSGGAVGDASSPLNIGRRTNGARYFHGLIDEARVADSVRSPAWMAVQFASMTDALLDVQAATVPPGC